MMENQLKQMLEMVEQFNDAFGIKYAKRIDTLLTEYEYNDYCLRYGLMEEENGEYLTAINEDNFTEVCDAVGDMLFILLGTILKHGLQDKIFDIVKEIHRSNMTKLDENGKPVIREDGKIIKGANYQAPQLDKIIYTKKP